MSLGDVKIKLNLDGKELEIGVVRAKKLIRELKQSVDTTSGAIDRQKNVMSQWARNLRHASLTLAAIPYALDTLNRMFMSLPTSIVRANAELERLNQLMIGLTRTATTYAEAQEEASRATRYLIDMADRTPFDLQALTDGMVKFKSAGLDPLNGSFDALVNAVAKYGGTSQHLHRASIAIQQMAGKGVISMEELRQQLGEAVPDAIHQMARSMGVSMGELVDKISRGTVESQNAISAMLNQMAFETIGAAKAMSQTWDGLMNRLKLRWMLALKEMGDQGGFDQLKSMLQELVEFLGTEQFRQAAADFGRALANIVGYMKQLIEFVTVYGHEIKVLMALLVAYKVLNSDLAKSLGQTIASSYGILTKYIGEQRKAMAASSVEMQRYHRQLAVLNGAKQRLAKSGESVASAALLEVYSHRIAAKEAEIHSARTAALSANLSRAAGAMRGMGMVMLSSVGWAGALTGAMYLLHKAYDAIWGAEKRWTAAIEENRIAFSRRQLEQYRSDLAKMAGELNAKESEVERLRQRYEQSRSALDYRSYTQARDELRLMRQNHEEFIRIIQESEKAITESAASAISSRFESDLSTRMQDASRAYVSMQIELDRMVQDRLLTREEANERLVELRTTQKDELLAVLDQELKANVAQTEALLALQEVRRLSMEEALDLQALRKNFEVLQRVTLDIERLQTGMFDMVLTTGADKGATYGEKSPIARFLDSTKAKVEGLREELMGGMSDLAKFEVMLAAGKYGVKSGAEVDQIREQLTLLAELKARREDQKKSEQEIQSAQTVLANLMGRVNAETERLNESKNPWLAMSTGSRQAEKSLAQMIEKFAQAKELTPEMAEEQERLVAAMRDAVEAQRELDMLNAMQKMKDETDKLNKSLLTQKELIEANYSEAQSYLEEFRALNQELIDQDPELQAVFESYKAAIERDYVRATEHSVAKVLREWSDTSDAMDRIWSNAMNGMSRSLTDFLVKGKSDFSSFLEDLVHMIVQAQINKYMAQAFAGVGGGGNDGILGAIIGGITGMMGGSSTTPGSSVTGEIRLGSLSAYANGGVITGQGNVALRKYASGGIAHHPQLALYGEGSRPEAFVPLPDGRTIPVTLQGGTGQQKAPDVHFNVINQSGTPMIAEEQGRSFDGEKMILDVVLKAAQQPGKFRSGLKGAMKS